MSLPVDDAVSLPVILAWLRVNWGKMVLGGVAFTFVAFPIAYFKPKTYESAVTLLVSPPTFKDRVVKPLAPRDPLNPNQTATIAEMMPRALPVETYKVLALSAPVLDEVIRKVPLKEIGVKALEDRLQVELVQMGSRSSLGVMYTQALMFRAKAQDPKLAAQTAQAWAEVFKEQVDRTAAEGVSETFTLLDTLHTKTKTELEQAELALAEHLKLWDLDLIKAQMVAKQLAYTDFETALKQAEVDIASGELKLKSLEEELAKEPEKLVYFRAPSDDAYWIAGLGADGKAKGAPDKGLRTEEANQNHVETRTLVVTAKEELEGLKAKKDAVLLKLDELKKEMSELTAILSDKTVERSKLTREADSLKESYGLVRAEFERGRMADQTQASDIVIAGDAVAPDVPSSTSNPKFVIYAALLGMFLTGVMLVAKEVSEMAPGLRSGAGEQEILKSRHGNGATAGVQQGAPK